MWQEEQKRGLPSLPARDLQFTAHKNPLAIGTMITIPSARSWNEERENDPSFGFLMIPILIPDNLLKTADEP